ncbi:MAG TPA: CDP-alcohol phosphatidyltransferase family protein [Spirochaetota bacterium]|nr:CDP-alcohol phosphatidyltransferase family protein [Spirochaetota bacterium]
MVTQAVMFTSRGDGSALRERVVLGHPLIARAIISSARAGVKEFFVVCDEGADELAAMLDANKVLAKHDCVVQCLSATKCASDAKLAKKLSAGFLLIPDTAVVKQELVARFAARPPAKGSSLLLLDSDTRSIREYDGIWRVRLDEKSGKLAEAGRDLDAWNASWTGLALCPGQLLGKIVQEFVKRPEGWYEKSFLKFFTPATTGFTYCAQDYAINVCSPQLAERAEKILLNSVRKATDGFVSRNFNRYVSLFLSRWLIRVGASPNFISGANLLLGVMASILLGMGGHLEAIIAALLFQFTSIVDGSDGEVAKLTWTMSPNGAWIDTICDQLTYVMFFVALPLGLYFDKTVLTEGGNPLFIVLGGVTLLAFGAMFWLMSRYVKRVRGEGSMLQIIKDIEESAKQPGLGGLVDRMVMKISFIFRRDFFAFATMIVLIAGLSAPLMWLISSLCTIQVGYLWLFSQRRFRMLGLRKR